VHGPDGVLLLSIQMERNLIRIQMAEIELIIFRTIVERSVSYESDHDACGQLSGEQLLVTDI